MYLEISPDATQLAYDYDDNGNTLSRSDGTDTVSYTWDAENRMVSADDGSTVTNYGYDADGIRISSETDGEVTKYLVDKNRDYAQVLEETDGSGGLIVSYVYGDDLIRQKRGDAFSYYQYDGQLSTRQLTDADGNVTDTYTYDAFGDVLSQSGSTENSYLYTGEQYDPNAGFYYLRARYYDPAGGRFLSSDPYAGRTNEPVTLHKYLYANANPVMNIDPSGLYSLNEVGVIQAMEKILITTQRYMKFEETIDKIDGLVSFIGGISKLISMVPKILDSERQSLSAGLSSFVSGSHKDKASRGILSYQFWDEAAADFLGNIGNIIGQSIKAGWPKKIVSNLKGKNPALLIYAPTLNKGFGMRTSKPIPIGIPPLRFGRKQREIPVMLVLGSHGSKGGRLTGFGVSGNRATKNHNQVFRMDWHNKEGHDRSPSDYDRWESGQFHYHVTKAK